MKTLLKIIAISCLGLNISACKPEFKILHPHIIYYGDSLCTENYSPNKLTATQRLGIPENCKYGRPMRDIAEISSNYTLAFLAMGTNDARLGVSIEAFSLHLNDLLSNTSATVVCVLPNIVSRINTSAVRAEMANQCVNIIDPQKECDVGPRFVDGLHYTEKDHVGMASCIQKAMTAFDNDELL
ncbi:MAG: hypothetical protein HRU20_05180 [Pseudomonadales bacterium]|nr:hypothetical protein [Pseudomonadales bacterium]